MYIWKYVPLSAVFLCVCALLNEIELIAYVWIFFLHRTNYILLRWPGLLHELKWNLNKPKFFLYWNLSTDKSKFIIYKKQKKRNKNNGSLCQSHITRQFETLINNIQQSKHMDVELLITWASVRPAVFLLGHFLS